MRNWADLPGELLSLIMSNLFCKDRHTFSLVCKSWNAAALVSPRSHSPCLMFYQRSSRLWKLYQYNGFFSMEIPQLDNADILCSKCGWLLMSRNRYNLFFFNPYNNQSFEVPKVMEPYKIFCFFNPPTSSNCIIVGFYTIRFGPVGGRVAVGVLKWGNFGWNCYEYNCNVLCMPFVCNPILHRGLLYVLDAKGNVGTFNIEQSNWSAHANCLLPAGLQVKLRQHFLIKLDGEEETILAVFVYGDGKKVGVYRLLEPDMKWELVEDVRDKMLFVSRVASFAKTAPVKSMGNKIYFPSLYDEDDSVVFFSLDTQKYHSFGGRYSNHEYDGLKELNFAAWVANISPKRVV